MMQTKTKIWIKPAMVSIGKVGNVAGAQPPAFSQTNGGPACTIGQPSCQFS
jgi:hypothetical protein